MGIESPVDVLVTEHVVLKTGQIMMIKFQLRSEMCLKSRLMLLTPKERIVQRSLGFLGDTVVRIGDDKSCWYSVTNRDSQKKLTLKMNLVIASATLVLQENLTPDSF